MAETAEQAAEKQAQDVTGPQERDTGIPVSVLVIQFVAPGSSEFNLQGNGIVTSNQLAIAGQRLLWLAEHQWDEEDNRRKLENLKKPKIAVPQMRMQG